eukprot:TRINITY_DN28239_c0_g1_i3.p3 TRINITY_DN28239_c0_g1~~TRINITY_DN28239_c0_g1_i3.p3  ORF type:complete len:100 (-),score=25.45 TRINITY_DN28239_c0_g1_i3:331-630(-)
MLHLFLSVINDSLSHLLFCFFFFLMIRRPPRSTLSSSSAASDVYKRQHQVRSMEERFEGVPMEDRRDQLELGAESHELREVDGVVVLVDLIEGGAVADP